MKVGIIGCGVVGLRRARIARAAGDRVLAVCDPVAARAQKTAAEVGAAVRPDWQAMIDDASLDAVVVATTHRELAQISASALAAGQHVLCEKPGGMEPAAVEANSIAARAAGLVYQIGYTHRFHRHLQALEQAVRDDALGRLHFVRAVLGNGGRPGFEQEWRADGAQAGGGVLMDLGVHLLEFSRALAGPLTVTGAALDSAQWLSPSGIPVEDNALLTLRNAQGMPVGLHASWTQWSNTFSFEVSGECGAILASGLGGVTYGRTTLIRNGSSQAGVRPDRTVMHFDAEVPQASWEAEWAHFAELVGTAAADRSNGRAAAATLQMVVDAYALAGSTWPPQQPKADPR